MKEKTIQKHSVGEDYRKALFSFVQYRVNNKEIAEDIVQDVFFKMYKSFDGLNNKGKLKAWMYQVSRNAIVDHYRKKKFTSENDLPETLHIEEVPTNESLEELTRCIKPMVNNLPEKYKAAVYASEIEGVKQKEIAERLNISLSGAKSRIQRGRKLLKDMFLGCCKIELDSRSNIIKSHSQNCNEC